METEHRALSNADPLFGIIVISVQAEKQFPSIMTRSPESRILVNISKYFPSEPPISSRMRVTAYARSATARDRIKPGTAYNFINAHQFIVASS
jgi:hypothetical protein